MAFRFNTISRIQILNSPGGDQMIHAIEYEGNPNLFITGVPGSGKTTVNLMRAERLANLGRRVLLITFQDLLATSLKNSASAALAGNIATFHRWYWDTTHIRVNSKTSEELIAGLDGLRMYDEILIDEGQDLEGRFYQCLAAKCRAITASADNAQRVHRRGLRVEQIRTQMQNIRAIHPVPLQYNYRNTFEIYNFARQFQPLNERANSKAALDRMVRGNGAIPSVFLVLDEAARINQLRILLTNAGERNTAVLLYKKEDVDRYHTAIRNMGFACTKHHADFHARGQIENILVTTLKSAKGIEFQVVILPEMENAMQGYQETAEHYYIGATRAKESLFLLIKGQALPSYLQNFDRSTYNLIS